MKETELKEVMNEVVDKIYESASANLKVAQDFWMDARKANWEVNMKSADEFYSRAMEDLSIIVELTGQDWEVLYDKAPFPFSEEEITKWWE